MRHSIETFIQDDEHFWMPFLMVYWLGKGHYLTANFITIYMPILLYYSAFLLHCHPSPGITCPVLSNPANGQVLVDSRVFGSVAIYVCDDGFVLVGEGTRVCSENGQWSGTEPQCEGKGFLSH